MNRHLSVAFGVILVVLVALLCVPAHRAISAPARGFDEPTPVYGYRIINTYPHNRGAFTQGLIYDGGYLYEGTGSLGDGSSLRKVALETGRVLQIQPLSGRYFGEGITLWQDNLIQLTWQSHVGFVYDKESFRQLRSFNYPQEIREGWGITHDGTRLMMSDGTPTIHFLNPETFERIGCIRVHDRGEPVPCLNELEYIKGEVFANVWRTNYIVRFSPETGQVLGWIDLAGLLSPEDARGVDVLNGIAYDAEHERLFVTGKLWPKLFEIQPVLKPDAPRGVIYACRDDPPVCSP